MLAWKPVNSKGVKNRPPRYAVQLRVLNNAFGSQTPALIRELAINGCFVEALPQPEGKILDIEFSFPGQNDSFIIMGRIAWTREPNQVNLQGNLSLGMGIRFLQFKKGSKEAFFKQLNYWGELIPAKGPYGSAKAINTTNYKATQSIAVATEKVLRPTPAPLDPNMDKLGITFNDSEIDAVLDHFMSRVNP